jgi:hypothetical protein
VLRVCRLRAQLRRLEKGPPRRRPGRRELVYAYERRDVEHHVRRGQVAFVWLPADLTGLSWELVASEPRNAGLAAGHQLAARARLSVLDLSDEPIMWTRRAPRWSPSRRLI